MKVFKAENNDIVVASRFMKGGSMKGCPFIKSILVRDSIFYLCTLLSSIPVQRCKQWISDYFQDGY